MIKKLVSLLLITALLLTVLPTAVLAGEITADAPVATLEPEESEVTEPIPGTCITEEELEDVLVGLFGAMEAEEFDAAGNANRAVNYAYTQRTASQDLIEFIMVHENSIQASYKPMWDVLQWSIGFGSRCPSAPSFYKNPYDYTVDDFPGATKEEREENMEIFMGYWEDGMPLAEAEALLKDMVNESFAPAVNNIAQKYNITLTQSQFDALVDFSYALGAGWTYGCRLRTGLVENYHGQTWTTANSLKNPGWFFINGVGTWCTVAGSADHGAATRRLQELEMFQYGDYYGNYRYDQVPNGQIHYTYLLFNGNGGTLVQPTETDWTTSNRFYFTGSPYGSLMNATRSGYYFAGWYTAREGGTKITADTIAQANRGSYAGITVYAHWSKTPVDPEIGSPNNGSSGGTTPSNPPAPSTGFTDVKSSDWFADEVMAAVEQGLMNGIGNNKFDPNGSLTRSMVVTMLYRMADEPNTTISNPFTDVQANRFYTKPVLWAYENGITTGSSATTFSPDAPITRQDLATMLYRYAKYRGENTSKFQAPGGYTDFDQISGYAIQAMCWCWSNELIKGYTTTTLAPQNICTRAQAATIFVRYMDQFE